MNSRTLILSFLMFVSFAGATAFLAFNDRSIAPESPAPAIESVVRSTSKALAKRSPRTQTAPVSGFSSRPRAVSSSRWTNTMNTLPINFGNQIISEVISNPEEANFVRLAMAFRLNLIGSDFDEVTRRDLSTDISSRLRNSDVPLLEGLQILAVDHFKGDEFKAEAAAVRGLLSEAAKESSIARILLQDLVLRELVRNPGLSLNEICERFELDPSHPSYAGIQKTLNRQPASEGLHR